jgi:hypothetical protein
VKKCRFDAAIYGMMDDPKIAVVDRGVAIFVYGIGDAEVESGSALELILKECCEDRFPVPCVVFGGIRKLKQEMEEWDITKRCKLIVEEQLTPPSLNAV